MKKFRPLVLSVLISVVSAASAHAQPAPLAVTGRMPDHNARSVCVDTHLNLTFNAAPTPGPSGQIRSYDAADNKLVDTVDVSLPTNQQNYVIG